MPTYKLAVKNVDVTKDKFKELFERAPSDVRKFYLDILENFDDPKLWSGLNQPNSTEYRINAKSSVPFTVVIANFYLIASKLPPKPIFLYVDEEHKNSVISSFKVEHSKEVSSDLQMENYDFGASSDGCSQIIFDSSDFQSAVDTLLISLSDSVYQPWRINSVYVQESLKERFMAYMTNERLETSIGGFRLYDHMIKDSDEIHSKLVKEYGCEIRGKKDGSVTILFDIQPNSIYRKYGVGTIKPITVTFFRTIDEAALLLNNNSVWMTPSSLSIWTEEISTLYTFLSKVNTDTNLIWCNTIAMAYDDLFERSAFGIQPTHKIDQNRKVVASCYNQNGKPKCLYIVFGK